MMIDRIVDRQHVSTSSRGIIRAIRKALIKKVRSSQQLREWRHKQYRDGLKRHAENRSLYGAVTSGRF